MPENEQKEYFNFIDIDDIPRLLPFLLVYAKKRQQLIDLQKKTGITSNEECQKYHGVKSCEECPMFEHHKKEEREMIDVLKRLNEGGQELHE